MSRALAVALCLGFVALIGGRLVLRVARPDLAVRLAYLAGNANPDSADDRPGIVRSVPDPWSSTRWGVHVTDGDDVFYSFGPDGRDDRGRGDDVVALLSPRWEGRPEEPFWSAMLWRWWPTLVLSVSGALAVTRQLSRSISPRRHPARECAVAALAASPVALVGSVWCAVVWRDRTELELAQHLDLLEGWSVLPVPLAATASLSFAATLAVLALRTRRAQLAKVGRARAP